MVKKIVILFMLLCLFMAACSPSIIQPSANVPTSSQEPTQSGTEAQSSTENISSCTYVTSPKATTDPTGTATSLFDPVSDSDWVTGSADASLTIIEYVDFQCSSCAALNAILNQMLKEFPEDLRVVLRFSPDSNDDKAMISAQAAEAAGVQGKFWEMANLLFSEQQTWSQMNETDFETWITGEAKSLSLDVTLFTSDMHSDKIVNKLTNASEEDKTIGIPYIPFVLINGEIFQGSQDENSLTSVVRLLLLEKMQVIGCPPTVIDIHKTYLAHLNTDIGEIVIQLFANQAPIAVNSFVFLARRGWYDGVTFHRVIAGSIAQAGDPSGTGYGGPGYAFKNEISPNLNFDKAGMVGMANAGVDSNGSQFFITMTSRPDLDGAYTVFGQVVQGMDVVQKLTPRDPSQAGPLPDGDKIISVTIEEK